MEASDDEVKVDMIDVFPTEALLPKAETLASDFLEQFPEYNGKHVTIGILDTGIDPGAIGMSHLVDTVDCTGSGDVDVSHCVTIDTTTNTNDDSAPYYAVTGLSGKTLRLSKSLQICPFPKHGEVLQQEDKQGETDVHNTTSTEEEQLVVRLGIKRGYELFPNKLVNRLKEHRRRELDQERRRHAAVARSELDAWTIQYSSSTTIPKEQLQVKESIQARLELLEDSKEQEELFLTDPGPLYDCVVYYDGTRYRAILDLAETGDLTSTSRGMAEFRQEREYKTFGTIDQFNYAVNFYSHGTVLSIVCDAGAHGSHVAGIAAGCHDPIPAASLQTNTKTEESSTSSSPSIHAMSGVAPGANIISFKIGDTRLGSMETGTSLTRALIEAVRLKCDVINLSYGEGCVLANRGRFAELADDLVHRHGIIFVSSAGNNGPAISTVGAPGGTTSAILSIAAYVSPAMMAAEYSMRNDTGIPGTTYTWSSTGPSSDGNHGVDLMAPGGAIASVPNWTLQRNQLMNGTSMSSPNATGCVALLLSACKANHISIQPNRIRRALEQTAKPMPGISALQQGWGMIQVTKAWEYILANKDAPYEDVNFEVSIDNRVGSPKGVYLRQPYESSVKQSLSVHVNPRFKKMDVEEETQRRRVEFEMLLNLKSTVPWVKCPDHFMLMHNGRSFKIEVDPTQLPPGVHTAKVMGYDSTNSTAHNNRGAIFSVPITVVRTLKEEPDIRIGKLEFAPTEVKRFFLSVPAGATWMDVTVRDCRQNEAYVDSSPRLMVLHAVQLLPHMAYRDAETQKYLNLLPSETSVSSIKVHAGMTCELAMARYWSTAGDTMIDVRVQFRGVTPIPESVSMKCGGGGAMVRVSSHLADEMIQPSAKLTKWKSALTPKTEGIVTPLSEDRDMLPAENKRIYQLVLTYEFNQEEAGSFTPIVPALQGVLYESAYESQLILAFDGNKKYLGVSDAFPSEIKAPKGNVTLRLQVRHDDTKLLEKLKDLPIWIERKLEKDISLSSYASKESMMTGSSTMKKRILKKGTCCSVFLQEPPSIPTSCKCGDILMGSVSYGSGEASLPGNGKRPGGYPVEFIVGPKMEAKKEEKSVTPEVPDERSIEEKLDEAVRKLKVDELQKLISKQKKEGDKLSPFEDLFGKLRKDYNDHIPLLMTGLKYYDQKEKRSNYLQDVIDITDKILPLIPEQDLAAHFGMGYDKEDPKSCKEHKEWEEKKSFRIEALARKARALSDLNNGSEDTTNENAFGDALKELNKWMDIEADNKYAILVMEREEMAGRYGTVMKLLNSLLAKDGETTKGGICPLSKSDLLEKRAAIFEKLGYTMLLENDKKWRLIAAPKSFMPF